MESPFDEAIDSSSGPAGPIDGAAVEGEITEARPPGGKALLRLLALLESAGLEQIADAVKEAAAPPLNGARADTPEKYSASPGEGYHERGEEERLEGYRSSAMENAGDAEGEARGLSLAVPAAENFAREAAEAHLAPPGPGPQWRSLGPWTIPNGQTYGASRVNVSGRVSAIVVDRSNPAHLLLGAANGGIWESFNRGGSWAPRSDFAPTLAIGALVFDPVNTAIAYAGTGEGNWWSFLGAGILRSTNGGTTWALHCGAPFIGQGFFELIINPGNIKHMLAGTSGGLYVSTDAGVTWIRRRAVTTWSISMAPAGGPAAEILAGCSDGMFRSVDGGATWTRINPPGGPANFNRLAVAIAPSAPAVAYAWGAGATGFLWRRAGGAWTAVGLPPGVNIGQAWYDWFLSIAPDRDTQIYCGAIEIHRGDLAGAVWTWRNLTAKPAGDSIHPDQHALAFEPGAPNTIYAGNDGGLYRSPDRGITWQHCNNGLVISEFEYIAHDWGSARWLMGGTQDNGTERWTGSPTWEHIADGDGGDCGVNRANPNTVFHTYYGMSPERSTTRGNFGSWAWLPPPVPAGEESLFYPPFQCSESIGDTLAIGGDALYVSRNNATTWTRLAFPAAARSSALAIPNPNTIYVGVTDGRIFRTTWGGAAWTALAAVTTPRANAFVSDIMADPTNVNRLWVTLRTLGGGRVFRSDNAGGAWADRTAGLPNLPMNAVEVDPWNPNRIWVGADLGVYQSLNGGASWGDYSNGLPNMYVGDLLLHPHARVLRAGTRNRGVWEIPVDGWMTQPICGLQFTGTLAANQSGRWFTFNWPATWHMIWTVMPTTPRPGAPQVDWTVQVERASSEFVTYWITVRNLTPAAVTFEGRYCIFSRY
jgi:photosystem II stability/assembly factor-like uncharacterized protein